MKQISSCSNYGFDEPKNKVNFFYVLGMELMSTAGRLMWEQNIPVDFDRPWDLQGSHSVSR